METTVPQNILRLVIGIIQAAVLFFGVGAKVRQDPAPVKFLETVLFGILSAFPLFGVPIVGLMTLLNLVGVFLPDNKHLRWTLVITIPAALIAIFFGGYRF